MGWYYYWWNRHGLCSSLLTKSSKHTHTHNNNNLDVGFVLQVYYLREFFRNLANRENVAKGLSRRNMIWPEELSDLASKNSSLGHNHDWDALSKRVIK